MLKLSNYTIPQLVTIAIIGVMMMMESIDTNILNVAIPSMADSLQVTPLSLKFAVTSYLISLSIFIPISGYLADRYGAKRILLISIFSFGLFSFFCGMATSLLQLVCFRFLQGAAGALLVPVGRLLMLKVFPKQELVKVYLFISMPLLIGPLLAPYIGGLLVSYLDWRFIFFINVPFAIFTLLATLKYVDNYMQQTQRFNWPSFIMLALFLTSFAFWLDTAVDIETPTQQLLNLAVIVIALLLYLKIEFNIPNKIINYNLFKIRTYQLCFIGSTINRISLGARGFVIALYLQIPLQMTPIESGTLISSMAVGYLFSRLFINKYLKKIGFKNMLLWCNAGASLCTLLFCFIHEVNVFAYFVVILVGFFSAVVLLLLNVLCFSDVEQTDFASATGLNSTTQQLFVAVGVSFAAGCLFLFNQIFTQASVMSYQIFFIVLAIVGLIAQIPFMRLQKTDGVNLT